MNKGTLYERLEKMGDRDVNLPASLFLNHMLANDRMSELLDRYKAAFGPLVIEGENMIECAERIARDAKKESFNA